MPTPFTHLNSAQRLLHDARLPADLRAFLDAQRPAFLLGNIAADARVDAGAKRGTTHFYDYANPITEHPWRVMMAHFPTLQNAVDDAQRAFLAGYVAHLSIDEMWTQHMLAEYFLRRHWGEAENNKFILLHVLLITMDERDLPLLETWQAEALRAAEPHDWLPFIPDANLRGWRDLIYEQIKPGGVSKTLEIFGGRIRKTPEELRTILDSPAILARDLWVNVPPADLAAIEAQMYEHALTQTITYLREF